MNAVRITSDGTPHGTAISSADGTPLLCAAIRFEHIANKAPTCEVELSAAISMNVPARFLVLHPVEGQLREVTRIEFADGSAWEAA